ncbi:uncharacterized protein LOC62_03G004697 [Vanrija pseudolonga]|uniref:Uncharacterized protein n=1 Tax=Vanrija pseudolonga TaxID=143232 RepID=A0AAF0YB51_9TREE|nr:hypothetical protein LOC62_03G004697 [Vanrija pseudolonga]
MAREKRVVSPEHIRKLFPGHPTARTWDYIWRLRYETHHVKGFQSRKQLFETWLTLDRAQTVQGRFGIAGLGNDDPDGVYDDAYDSYDEYGSEEEA